MPGAMSCNYRQHSHTIRRRISALWRQSSLFINQMLQSLFNGNLECCAAATSGGDGDIYAACEAVDRHHSGA